MELVGDRTLQAFADDIVILGESQYQINSNTLELIETSQRIGLTINEDKIKYMIMSRHSGKILMLIDQ